MAIITNWYFEGFVLLLVLLSSVLLALDKPSLDDSSSLGRTINICDSIFVACFTLEMCLKVRQGASLLVWFELQVGTVIDNIVSSPLWCPLIPKVQTVLTGDRGSNCDGDADCDPDLVSRNRNLQMKHPCIGPIQG